MGRGVAQGRREFIVLGVPEDFPDLLAAFSSLPAALEQRMDVVIIEKAGSTVEFPVAYLKRRYDDSRAGIGMPVPYSIMGNTRAHTEWGNVIEPRRQVWPGTMH